MERQEAEAVVVRKVKHSVSSKNILMMGISVGKMLPLLLAIKFYFI